MRPFCQIAAGAKTFSTAVASGNEPKWNEEFRFEIEYQTGIQLVVYHKALLFGQTEVMIHD